jgi:hypothetical protein
MTTATEAQEDFAVSDLYDGSIVQAIVQRPRNGAVVI